MNPSNMNLEKATWLVGSPTNVMGLALIIGTENQKNYYVAVHVHPDDQNEKRIASRSFVTETDCVEEIIRQAKEKHECDILRLNEQEHISDYLGLFAAAYLNECAKQDRGKLQNTPEKQSLWQKLLDYFS